MLSLQQKINLKVVTHSKHKLSVEALLQLPVEYPSRPCVFALAVHKNGLRDHIDL